MKHAFLRPAASVAAALGLVMCAAEGAVCADLGFGPPTLELSARAHVGTVTLTNRAAEPVRFEIKVLRWSQEVDGRMRLEPSDDAVVFPQLMTIAAHEARRLRVSMVVPPGESEKTYRIQVTEIPQSTGSASASPRSIAMLSQLELPIFYAPLSARTASAVTGVTVRSSTLSFAVANTGTLHFKTKNLTVTALGSGGRVLFVRALDGWYVLPGGRREYRLPLAECGDVRALTISAVAGIRTDHTIAMPVDACRA